jgi:hypothetical protein
VSGNGEDGMSRVVVVRHTRPSPIADYTTIHNKLNSENSPNFNHMSERERERDLESGYGRHQEDGEKRRQ